MIAFVRNAIVMAIIMTVFSIVLIKGCEAEHQNSRYYSRPQQTGGK